MRGKVSKHIEEMVKNEEVLTPTEMQAEHKPNIRRRKKRFWNKINWKEKTKKSGETK